jgi:hypothetical protein
VRLVSSTGAITSLDILESRADGSRIKAGYWGPFDDRNAPAKLEVRWARNVETELALNADDIREAAKTTPQTTMT